MPADGIGDGAGFDRSALRLQRAAARVGRVLAPSIPETDPPVAPLATNSETYATRVSRTRFLLTISIPSRVVSG